MDMGGSTATEYADHEVQAVSAVLTTDDGLSSTEDSATAEIFKNFDPVSDRGLDSDEIAELVGMYRKATLRFGNVDGQSFGNSMFAEGSLGVNIAGESEEFSSLSANAPTAERVDVTPDPDTADSFLSRFASIDEPGILDGTSIGGSLPYIDGGGAGGSGQQEVTERWFNFRDTFGSGPFLDATDDLTLFQELEVNEVIDQAEFELAYILYWDTETVPEARRNFGRP